MIIEKFVTLKLHSIQIIKITDPTYVLRNKKVKCNAYRRKKIIKQKTQNGQGKVEKAQITNISNKSEHIVRYPAPS